VATTFYDSVELICRSNGSGVRKTEPRERAGAALWW